MVINTHLFDCLLFFTIEMDSNLNKMNQKIMFLAFLNEKF